VTLAWAASNDDVAVVAYRVYRSDDFGRTQRLVGTAASPAFTDAGLQPGAYRYVITAVDGAGNESQPSGAVLVLTALCVAGICV
jgi:fibronectin type 3 domain-containing protein